jgi:hypothetical protein
MFLPFGKSTLPECRGKLFSCQSLAQCAASAIWNLEKRVLIRHKRPNVVCQCRACRRCQRIVVCVGKIHNRILSNVVVKENSCGLMVIEHRQKLITIGFRPDNGPKVWRSPHLEIRSQFYVSCFVSRFCILESPELLVNRFANNLCACAKNHACPSVIHCFSMAIRNILPLASVLCSAATCSLLEDEERCLSKRNKSLRSTNNLNYWANRSEAFLLATRARAFHSLSGARWQPAPVPNVFESSSTHSENSKLR